ARCDQERRRNDDDHAIDQLISRNLSALEALVEPAPDLQAASLGENASRDAGYDNDCDRRPGADPVAHLNEQGQLNDRGNEEEGNDASKHGELTNLRDIEALTKWRSRCCSGASTPHRDIYARGKGPIKAHGAPNLAISL